MGCGEPDNAITFLEGGKSMKPPRIEEVRALPNKVLSIQWTTGEIFGLRSVFFNFRDTSAGLTSR